jgi:putative selenate reductase molybdopterin-binding subunit
MSDIMKTKEVGRSVNKLDGLSLASGAARFVADKVPPDVLYGAILTSPHAHARIKSIDKTEALAVPGVKVVLTYRDVPRVAHTTAGQGFPEPSPYDTFCLDSKVRFVGDRVAAVAAETPEAAQEALRRLRVEYEVLPAILDPRDSMKPGAPVIHDEPEARVIIPIVYEPQKNLVARATAHMGDVEAVFKECDVVLEGSYHFSQCQHCPMEPHVCFTELDELGRLTIHTSTQVPFHVRRITAARMQLPVQKVRVIKPRIGGGFGAKQEVLIEDLCSALTLATGKPVLLEYTRAQEFISSRTRHPQYINVRMGAMNNGDLKAIDLRILMDCGAYGAHGLTVVSNSGSKNLPLYRWKAVNFLGEVVYTNLPLGGAYRGYGATQSYFATECLLDELAAKLGLDPIALRQRNHVRPGESSPIFEALGEGKAGVPQTIDACGLPECLIKGAQAIGWNEKHGKAAMQTGVTRRGVGMCALMQGSSIPEIDMGSCYLKMNEDGSFNLQMGATDLGTGSDTVLSQIAAEVLGCATEKILPYSSDTDLTPFDVGAYASSTTYLTGNAVINTATKVADQIRGVGAEMLKVPVAEVRLEDSCVVAADGRKVTFEQVGIYSLYEKNQFQIQATGSHVTHKSPPPFSAHYAEV